MERLAELMSRPKVAWATVALVLAAVVASGLSARQLEQDDNLLAFLPKDNRDVALFDQINRRFGTTEIAFVGIQTPHPFSRDFLERLQKVTTALDELPELNYVLSLTNVTDFSPDVIRGGIVTAPLVDRLPRTPAEEASLEAKVMARDHVVGNLISKNADAVLIYCFLGYGRDPRLVADRISSVVTSEIDSSSVYWGGGPFVSTYIYNTTQRDLRRLTPWAIAAIVLVMVLIFRDLVGTLLVLVSTAVGTLGTLGLMAATKVPFNIVLTAMPVVLFAVGSAYGVHMLARYYGLRRQLDAADALRGAVREAGPVVLVAGLTTAASIL